jgi:hypothetical protein
VIITKAMAVVKSSANVDDRYDFIEALEKVNDYAIAKSKTNLTMLTKGFFDETLLNTMINLQEDELIRAVNILNDISLKVLGEKICTTNPIEFSLKLFQELNMR